MALLIGVSVAAFLLDRVSKLLADAYLTVGMGVEVLPSLLRLQLTRNTGMALGIFAGNSLLIIVLPVLAVLAGALAMRRYHLTHFTAVAAGLILGGFLGNFVDRVFFGYVLDMIYLPFLPFFVCNIADVGITLGVAMMAASLLLRPNDWRRKDAKPASGN